MVWMLPDMHMFQSSIKNKICHVFYFHFYIRVGMNSFSLSQSLTLMLTWAQRPYVLCWEIFCVLRIKIFIRVTQCIIDIILLGMGNTEVQALSWAMVLNGKIKLFKMLVIAMVDVSFRHFYNLFWWILRICITLFFSYGLLLKSHS